MDCGPLQVICAGCWCKCVEASEFDATIQRLTPRGPDAVQGCPNFLSLLMLIVVLGGSGQCMSNADGASAIGSAGWTCMRVCVSDTQAA
jgi:hypothetical protein